MWVVVGVPRMRGGRRVTTNCSWNLSSHRPRDWETERLRETGCDYWLPPHSHTVLSLGPPPSPPAPLHCTGQLAAQSPNVEKYLQSFKVAFIEIPKDFSIFCKIVEILIDICFMKIILHYWDHKNHKKGIICDFSNRVFLSSFLMLITYFDPILLYCLLR